MSQNSFIIRQFIVSSILLSALQCSSTTKFSSLRYPAPSMRKYISQPWKYVPFIPLPRSMQRRFMWKEMDDSVDGLVGNHPNVAVSGGGRPMNQVFSPPMVRYRQPFEFDLPPSKKVKYVLKKPGGPPPPPFKRIKVMKFRAPKQPIPLYSHPTITDPPQSVTFPSPKPTTMMPFMNEDDLRKIEKEQEKKVESESENPGAVGIHEHTHQTHMDDEIVSGRINEFGEDWLPMKAPFSTPKSFPLSRLHTKVEAIETLAAPTALPLVLSEPFKNNFSYEVTEHSAEATDQKDQTFKPSTFNFDFLSATTEGPNYPEYFLKTISKNEDTSSPTKRDPITTTVFAATTTTMPSPSRRLPPKVTTEHPFKRYNLHRPKPSKLFFQRPTSSSPDSTRLIQSATTTEHSYKINFDFQEPLKTTRESIRTTRLPPSTTTTKTTTTTTTTTTPTPTTKEPKKPPPEKVRNTRMNSEGKTKLRIKNVSQNESLNKVLNRNRGSVKFGEKTNTS